MQISRSQVASHVTGCRRSANSSLAEICLGFVGPGGTTADAISQAIVSTRLAPPAGVQEWILYVLVKLLRNMTFIPALPPPVRALTQPQNWLMGRCSIDINLNFPAWRHALYRLQQRRSIDQPFRLCPCLNSSCTQSHTRRRIGSIYTPDRSPDNKRHVVATSASS
jgi:hypothetical protein